MQYQATQMANFKVGIILLYMIIITIHTPLVWQNDDKLIKGVITMFYYTQCY
jgi:hypothetical protein